MGGRRSGARYHKTGIAVAARPCIPTRFTRNEFVLPFGILMPTGSFFSALDTSLRCMSRASGKSQRKALRLYGTENASRPMRNAHPSGFTQGQWAMGKPNSSLPFCTDLLGWGPVHHFQAMLLPHKRPREVLCLERRTIAQPPNAEGFCENKPGLTLRDVLPHGCNPFVGLPMRETSLGRQRAANRKIPRSLKSLSTPRLQ